MAGQAEQEEFIYRTWEVLQERGYDYSLEQVRAVIHHKFDWLKHRMKNFSHAAILDNGLGNFYIPLKKVQDYTTRIENLGASEEEIEKYRRIRDAVKYYREQKKRK